MSRPRSTGLNTVTKRRADGTVTLYFYDRRTGAFLGHDRDAALKLLERENAASLAPADPPGSMAALIAEYEHTPKYRKLRPSTRDLYDRTLRQIRSEYGDLPVRGIRSASIERIKTKLQDQPGKANMTLAMLRILLKLAVRLNWIVTNPAAAPGRIPIEPRSEIWLPEDEDRFLGVARPSLQLAFLLLLYTVQRPADVLEMTTDRVSERDGRMYIALKQRKTGTLIDVPVHARIELMLRARLADVAKEALAAGSPGRPRLLVPSPKGLVWRYRNFARAWDRALGSANLRLARQLLAGGMDKAAVRAELEKRHRQRRDLRRTGVVRLAEAGATTPQIAALSGHSIDYCQRIIDTYLPRRTEVALGGIEAWERHQGDSPSKIVRLASVRRNRGQ